MFSFKSRAAHAIEGLLLDNGEKLMGSGECVKPWVLERREAAQKYKTSGRFAACILYNKVSPILNGFMA